MPTDDAYDAVIRELTKVFEELRQLADALKLHRDVVFRAINLLNGEVVGFTKRLNDDDAARVSRQGQIDAKLESISAGQLQIRRWQWIRLGVEVLVIIVVAAYLYGVSR